MKKPFSFECINCRQVVTEKFSPIMLSIKVRKMSDLEYIEAEAKRSLSGMTLDVAHWPFMQPQCRFISYNKVGPWCNSTAEALQAYKKEKDKNFL